MFWTALSSPFNRLWITTITQFKKPIEQLGIVPETETPIITGKDTRITGLAYISHKLAHATCAQPLQAHFTFTAHTFSTCIQKPTSAHSTPPLAPPTAHQLHHWHHLPRTNSKLDQSWLNPNQDWSHLCYKTCSVPKRSHQLLLIDSMDLNNRQVSDVTATSPSFE